jgi:hypothetical protein
LPTGPLIQPSSPSPETPPAGLGAEPSAQPDGARRLDQLWAAPTRIAVYREANAPPEVVSIQILSPGGSAALIAGRGAGGAGNESAAGWAPGEGGVLPGGAGTGRGGSLGTGVPGAVTDAAWVPEGPDSIPQFIELLTARAYGLAREQGGIVPVGVFRELIANLVHASFAGVVVTILDRGNTIRISDQGPGIPDKQAALRPGFTSADAAAKRYIRGVGSGFSVVRETLGVLGGTLEIEDNLGKGTVVTAHVPPPPETPLAPVASPAYNLPERQLKVLLLTVELAPVGPTRIAQELGVSTSTAYRDLVSLEQAGFVVCRPSGHRSATDAGIAYLDAVL